MGTRDMWDSCFLIYPLAIHRVHFELEKLLLSMIIAGICMETCINSNEITLLSGNCAVKAILHSY